MGKRRNPEEFQANLTSLLIAEGISKLKVEDIAHRLKCSRRRIYELAPSKEALFISACERAFNQNLKKGYAAARQEQDATKAIPAYLKATLNSSGLTKAALTDLDSLTQGQAVFDAYQTARIRGLESMLEEGIRQGVLVPHNPRLLSEAILGAAFRIRKPSLLSETGLSIGEAFAEFYDVLMHGVLIRD